jgi:hypothetical protein
MSESSERAVAPDEGSCVAAITPAAITLAAITPAAITLIEDP